jgi:spore coat protein CotF
VKLAQHEAYELHELAMSCVNTITNMALFLGQVQDQQLKSILQTHFPLHCQDYNMKVEYLSMANGSAERLPTPDINQMLSTFTNAPVYQYAPVTPRTTVQMLNDREIATSYLLTLKRAGREYAWAAMEAANPELRAFLEDAFKLSSRHAFEVWQWMVQQGYYPLEATPQPMINTFSQFYQQVPQP